MFKWQDSFSSGIEEIDNQHRKLIEIGSRVYDTALLNDDYDHYDELMAILQELVDYTQYHFGYEEELFEKYNYEKAFEHKIEHEFFIKKLKKITSKDLDNSQREAFFQLLDFLSDWITGHILGSDKEYRECFLKGG